MPPVCFLTQWPAKTVREDCRFWADLKQIVHFSRSTVKYFHVELEALFLLGFWPCINSLSISPQKERGKSSILR